MSTTSTDFVRILLRSAEEMAAVKVDHYAASPPLVPTPEEALAGWYRGLSEQDRAMARRALIHFMGMGAFMVLGVLDGTLPELGGTFELYHVRGDTKERFSNLMFGG